MQRRSLFLSLVFHVGLFAAAGTWMESPRGSAPRIARLTVLPPAVEPPPADRPPKEPIEAEPVEEPAAAPVPEPVPPLPVPPEPVRPDPVPLEALVWRPPLAYAKVSRPRTRPARQEPAPPAPPPAPRVRARFLDGRNRPPEYPRLARARGYEGVVLLEILVAEDGKVVRVGVLRSSGYEVLDAAAVRAAGAWRFEPAHEGDEAVRDVVQLEVQFVLAHR